MIQSDFIFLIFILIAQSNPIDLENLSGLLTFLKQCGLHLVEHETNHLGCRAYYFCGQQRQNINWIGIRTGSNNTLASVVSLIVNSIN